MKLKGLDHVAISVSDLEHSAEWYCDTLGFKRMHDGMWGGVPTFIGIGGTGLALFPAGVDADKISAGKATIDILHIAFGADRATFAAAQKELEERGIRFEFQDHEISHSIYFHDPDGHRLEITTYEV